MTAISKLVIKTRCIVAIVAKHGEQNYAKSCKYPEKRNVNPTFNSTLLMHFYYFLISKDVIIAVKKGKDGKKE